MKIAVEGCCHGELDKIYETMGFLERVNNYKVDLLLICGDFQSVRNKGDMECMAVPSKHKQMNTFYKYYSGEKVAPVLTIFIGGNHEASNYLQELPYGGWVAPKIYYLGYAGVVQYRGVRIGGLSGIYKGRDYLKGHFEHPPYDDNAKRSVYHIRNLEAFRLKQIKSHLDIFLSHDWPRGIYNYGNANALMRKKIHFREEVKRGILGNPVAQDLLSFLKPDYWFSAHLHVKFPALVQHSADDESKITKFLALDKCLPKRQFLQVLDIPHDSSKPAKLSLDPEWLVILKLTNHLLDLTKKNNFPGPSPGGRASFIPTDGDIKQITEDFGGDFSIPENFKRTVQVYDPKLSKNANKMKQPKTQINEQTTLICSMLDLTDPNAVFLGKDSTYQLPEDLGDTQELDEEDEDDDDKQDDVDDDYESEISFISDSDRSHSFLSMSNDSFLSASNESFQLVGNESFVSAGNESFTSLGNADDNSFNNGVGKDNELGKNAKTPEEFVLKSNVHKLSKESRRISLSEKLAQCNEGNKSNSASSTTTSDEDDLEFQAILSAQKAEKETSKSQNELEAAGGKSSSCSDSSIDCKQLEISDEDPELLEMMKAQRKSQSSEKRVIELSLDSEDVEYKDIVKAQKERRNVNSGSLPEIQRDFQNLGPSYHSSPMVSNEDRIEYSMAQKDLSPSSLGMKRGDTVKTNESPATKKFRRRNQDMYSDNSNSTGEEDL